MKLSRAIFILLGLGLIVVHGITAWLSHQFIFGQGYQERPIIGFVMLMGVAGIMYMTALEFIRRESIGFSKPNIIMFICITAIVMRFVYAFSNLIQETDPFRYIWDGQSIVQGANPYQHSPLEAYENKFKPFADKPIVQDVYQRINHQGVKTIYPPLAQGLFAISQWFTPWKIDAWKMMVALADCVVIGLLIASLRRLNIPTAWIAIYAWSPLIIKEFSNSIHLDVFALACLSLMIYAIVRGWVVTAYLALATSVLVKLFAIILLPLLIVWQLKANRNHLNRNILMFFGGLILAYLPFLNAGILVGEGLGRFLSEWKTNDGLFGLIYWAVSVLPIDSGMKILISRAIAVIAFGIGLALIARWLSKSINNQKVLTAMAMTVAIFFFLLPTGNPWYYTWVLLFVPFLLLRSLLVFSILVFAYYLDFYFTYRGSSSLFVFVQWIEYGIFILVLGGEIWRRRLPSLSLS